MAETSREGIRRNLYAAVIIATLYQILEMTPKDDYTWFFGFKIHQPGWIPYVLATGLFYCWLRYFIFFQDQNFGWKGILQDYDVHFRRIAVEFFSKNKMGAFNLAKINPSLNINIVDHRLERFGDRNIQHIKIDIYYNQLSSKNFDARTEIFTITSVPELTTPLFNAIKRRAILTWIFQRNFFLDHLFPLISPIFPIGIFFYKYLSHIVAQMGLETPALDFLA